MMRRRTTADAPGSDLSGIQRLDLIDIRLVTGSGEATREIPRLGLHFDANGVAVRKWDGESVVQIPWVSLRRLQTKEPDPATGAREVELAVETDRGSHRFIVPNVSVDALKASLGAMAARYANSGLVDDEQKRGFRLR